MAGINSQVNFIRIYSAGRQIITGAPEITSFTYDPANGSSFVSIRGNISTTYRFVSSSDLDFSNSSLFTVLDASVGTLNGDGVETDANGNATVELIMAGNARGFIRAEQ